MLQHRSNLENPSPFTIVYAAHSPLRIDTHILFQSSSSYSQQDMPVKPVGSAHAFGFGTNENFLGPVGGASQSVHNSQPYFQDEGDFNPKQPEQPNFQT